MGFEATKKQRLSEIVDGIRQAQPHDKLESDTLAAKIFYRRASYYFAAVLHKMGFSPTGISFLGAVLAVITLLVSWVWPSIVVVSILLIVVATTDCADGALARYSGKAGPKGELADAIGGYIILAVVPYVTWLMMLPGDERWTKYSMLFAALTGFFVALHYIGRSMYLKKRSEQSSDAGDSEKPAGMVKFINTNLSFCGFMFPLMIVFWIFGVPILSWLYAVGYVGLLGCALGLGGIKTALA